MTDLDSTKTPKEKKDGSQIDVSSIEGQTPSSYKPEGFDSQEDFLTDMRKQYHHDVDFDRINRDEALDDKRFSAGEQWDPEVIKQRQGLPCLVINSIPQFTAQLVGDWRESRKAIKVLANNDEDMPIASVRGDLIRSIENQSRADRVYDSSFESLVQCGDGAFRVSVEYARDDVFDQDIFIRPIEDALAVVWDRYSVDPTGRDARRVFVDDRIPIDEFDRKWPGASSSSLDDRSTFTDMRQDGWVADESYRITEYWRLIERKRLMAIFQNGKVFEISGDNVETLVEENGPPVKTRVAWVSYAQMHLVTGFAILSGPYEYRLNRLPIVRMSGRVVNVSGRRIRYGLVRFMKDPVRLKNFWRSVAAEQLGYAPKAQWIGPESAFEGREDTFRKAHLSRDPLLIYNDDATEKPERVEPPAPQAAILNEASQNAQDMKDVTGIHDASLGIKSNETSGRAIMARQREGDISSLTFHDNGNAAVLEAGDVINQLLPQIYDGTRIVRIIGEDEAVKFQSINDPYNPDSIDLSVGMFDVSLSTGTSYTTRRVEAAQAMMDAVQVFPQLMQVAGDLVAKAQDWPEADKLAERLKKTIPPQLLGDDEKDGAGIGVTPEQLQQMQQQLQQLGMENQQLKADKSIAERKLLIDDYNAQTARIKALSDNEVDGNQLELEAIKNILNSSAKLDEHDIQRAQVLHGARMKENELAQGRDQMVQDREIAEKQIAAKPTPKPSTSGSGNTSQQSAAG